MNINELRLRRVALEEELELWEHQLLLANQEAKAYEYAGEKSSKTIRRAAKRADDQIRSVKAEIQNIKFEIMSYTTDRLGLVDLL